MSQPIRLPLNTAIRLSTIYSKNRNLWLTAGQLGESPRFSEFDANDPNQRWIILEYVKPSGRKFYILESNNKFLQRTPAVQSFGIKFVMGKKREIKSTDNDQWFESGKDVTSQEVPANTDVFLWRSIEDRLADTPTELQKHYYLGQVLLFPRVFLGVGQKGLTSPFTEAGGTLFWQAMTF